MGLPFIPVPGLAGSDIMRMRPDFRTLTNPYDPAETVVVVPALVPDVAVFHADRADRYGNVLTDPHETNRILAQAAEITIVTAEEIVAGPLRGPEPGFTFVPGLYVTAVVEAPLGSHPAGCGRRYGVDAAHLREYARLARTEAGFAEYLERYVMVPAETYRTQAVAGIGRGR
ncbi:MAG: hypothetical protein K6V97_10575 [Actinomycetia bacterium]|nr:hypothetical protein [Actinomycetes bacterium]